MNLLHAQKPNAIGEDSLSLYKEMYSKFLASGDRERALYYGDKFVTEWTKEALPKDSLYISYVERLAILHYNSGDVVKAKQILEELIPIKKELYGEESSDFAILLSVLAICNSDLDNYPEAIRLATKALKIRKKVLGPDHPDYATSLGNLAHYFSSLGNNQEAIRFGTEALEILKKVQGPKHPSYATLLGNLTSYYSSLGNYQEAIRLGTKALEIEKKVLGPDHPDYAISLNNLARYYYRLGNYQEAIRLGTEALEIRKKVLGPDYPDYATSLSNLAVINSDRGNNQEAIRLVTEALEIRKNVLGSEHPDYATSLDNLAIYYYRLGNYQEAIRLGTEALKIRKKVLGPDHPDYATSLGNLALYFSSLGNYQEAIRLGTEALEIRKKVLGPEHPDYATSLNNLAGYFSGLGNYQEAIRLGTEALKIRKKVLGPDHPDYATSLNNLADYYFSLGNYQEAIRLGSEALKIRKKVLGPDHPDYATSLGNLASYYYYLGNYQEAIRLGTEALEIRKNVLGPDHPDYATSLDNLAIYYYRLGNYQEAIRLGTEALKIRKKVLGPDHPDYATSFGNLAHYYYYLGNYQEAIRLGTEALEIRKKVLGPEHPHSLLSLRNLSFYNYNQKNFAEAYRFQKSYINPSFNYILNIFSELSTDLKESLWNDNYAFNFNQFFPSTVYQHQTKESISELYDKTALFAKGILLNSSVGMRKLILESGDSVLISKYDALSANKSIYEKELEKPIKERFLNVDSLHTLIQQQEMELARESKAYGDFARNLRINWKDVQQKLDKNDIAIEFLDFPVLKTDSVMYVALTVKKGYDSPHMIPLFEKKQLDAISQRNYYTQTSLYDLVWKPLAEELKGVRDIYFSPSGSLHRIGIEYVPVSEIENIFDQYRLHRLSSTRQLAFIQDETSGKDNVLYGGLVYDAHPSQTDKLADNRSFTYMNRADVDSLSLRGSYEYLPGTKDEADNIATYLKKYGQSYIYCSGAQGTEESFKQLDGSRPKTLHIATHGFYMTQEDAEIQRLTSGVKLGDEGSHYQEDKPMTRSGLLLSGCGPALKHETLPEGVEDGILTAQEISKLDLRGLDLVVLSACQTGLGDIISGEGVFGLQRGFKNAGARTIIMSLWKVSDSATQQLMSSFYSYYLKGKGKEESFRLAQSELREKGSSNQSKPDWAAFVMLDGLE